VCVCVCVCVLDLRGKNPVQCPCKLNCIVMDFDFMDGRKHFKGASVQEVVSQASRIVSHDITAWYRHETEVLYGNAATL
jgi:hypothetical protein